MGGLLGWRQDLTCRRGGGVTSLNITKDQHKSQSPAQKVRGRTEQIVSGQGVQDARRPDQVAHGGGERGGVHPDGDQRVPDVDVPEETVISLQEDAGGEDEKSM